MGIDPFRLDRMDDRLVVGSEEGGDMNPFSQTPSALSIPRHRLHPITCRPAYGPADHLVFLSLAWMFCGLFAHE